MRRDNEDVDVVLILRQEGMDMALVEEPCALCLRKDEIGEEGEAEVGVEGEPADDEVGPVLDQDEDGVDDPIHEPWG